MANERYFLLCQCGGTHYLGKTLGDGIYFSGDEKELLNSLHEFVWDHLVGCHDGRYSFNDQRLGVICESHPQAPSGTIPPYRYDPPGKYRESYGPPPSPEDVAKARTERAVFQKRRGPSCDPLTIKLADPDDE